MIKVVGDRIYQWDLFRQVVLTGDDAKASQVHFAHCHSSEQALVVEVEENEDGLLVATIPNTLLMEHRDLLVWTWKDEDTISGKRFEVIRRNKPAGYIFTPSEVLTMESLKQWVVDELEKFKQDTLLDYTQLENKPSIEDVELVDDRKLTDFGMNIISTDAIDKMFE